MLKQGLTRDLLILLATLVDEIDAHSFQNQMRRLACDGWYKRSSVGPTVSRLLSVGEIEKIERGDKLYYRLTSKGSRKLKEDVPLFKLASKPWDGQWRIIIFDIEEKEKFLREALRDKLVSLGFGRWQRSVYITPHDLEQEINQYLQAKKLFPAAICLVARQGDLGDDKVLANKIWQLDDLNDNYQDFIDDCERLLMKKEYKTIKEEEVRNLWLAYKRLIVRDPFLPRELLPKGWLAQKARRILTQACRHFFIN